MEINLGRVLDALPAMVWTALPDGQIDFVSRRWSEYTGLSLDQAHGWEWQAAVNPDDLPKLLERWRSILKSGQPGEMEARLRCVDGKYRWFLVHSRPMHDDDGRIAKWCGVATDVDDFRQAQETLRRRELDFQLIVDSIPVPVAVTTPSGEVEGLNQPTLDYFGKTFEELKGWKASDVVHPDDLEQTAAAQLEAHQKGAAYNVESRHRRADGAYRWYNVRGFPLRDPRGNILRWFHLLIDIDDQKRAEEALLASERNLGLITNTIPALAWSTHADGSPDFFNQLYLDYVGISADQVEYWDFTVAVHPDDKASLIATWQAIMASGEPGEAEARLRRFDGEYRWFLFRANPLRNEVREIVKWYGINTDIDERVRAERALSASERYSRQIVDSIPSMVAVFTAGGELELVNHQVLEYYGRTFDELRSWATSDSTHPEDLPRAIELFTQSIASGDAFEFEVRTRRFDGIYHWFQSRGFPLRDANGRIVRWYNLLIDIDERKRAEEALSRARSELAHVARVSSLGALTASIAHEVNQPLSGIITNAGTCLRMLAADPPNVEGARETARRTIRDGNRAADVITRLRALFSKRATTVEPVDLNEAAREVIALSWGDLHRSRVVVRTDLADELPLVGGNRVQLQQVIMNLLRNASDAMIGVEGRTRRLVIKTETDERDHVRLSVQDTGVGFGPDGAERLFEAFYTTKSEGMGIGLSVSRSIIEGHHGRLWAAANDGPGATFSFSIPAHAGDEAPAQDTGAAHVSVTGIGQNAAEIS